MMPFIRFSKPFPPLKVPSGTSLMEALLNAGHPVASSCHGDGICAKCRLTIVEGGENLSRVTGAEKILKERLRLPAEVRISCQAQVLGDVTVDATYW